MGDLIAESGNLSVFDNYYYSLFILKRVVTKTDGFHKILSLDQAFCRKL